uniref:CD3 n=1 Tax=Paralichthys olivaceus TaxID=8255 RepID=Q90ZH4_PAROL|nr:CD3 [Paralichthys olivaceus]
MKFTSLLPACLLLLWTLPDTEADNMIKVTSSRDWITLNCNKKSDDASFKVNGVEKNPLTIRYKDESSGLYTCSLKVENNKIEEYEIYLKLQTCENCIELNLPTIVGLTIGDAVATILLGLAVYLIASQAGPVISHKKIRLSSGSERPLPNEMRNRASNDPYQRLRFNSGARKDTYDVINHNR